jgi:hypothetical protein
MDGRNPGPIPAEHIFGTLEQQQSALSEALVPIIEAVGRSRVRIDISIAPDGFEPLPSVGGDPH